MTETENKWYTIYIGDPKNIETVRGIFARLNIDFKLWLPKQNHITIANKKIPIDETLFPGYVLVNFDMNKAYGIESYFNDSTKNCYFLKCPGSKTPYTLTQEEVDHIESLEHSTKLEAKLGVNLIGGEEVEILGGSFVGFKGKVEKVIDDKITIRMNIMPAAKTIITFPSPDISSLKQPLSCPCITLLKYF